MTRHTARPIGGLFLVTAWSLWVLYSAVTRRPDTWRIALSAVGAAIFVTFLAVVLLQRQRERGNE